MTFVFKHPKYYTELRKRNKALRLCDAYSKENSNYTERQQSDQAISARETADAARAPGQGLKPRYTPTGILLGVDLGDKPQAASVKLQAPSDSNNKPQASSPKQQASSSKPQASSSKI